MERPGNTWVLRDGRIIFLLRPEQLAHLPPGTELVTISGRLLIVGTDEVDTDTRGGYLACGPVYQPGITEALVGRETMVPLDRGTMYHFEVSVGAKGGLAAERLVARGWKPQAGSAGPLLVKEGTPAEISADFDQVAVAISLGHTIFASVNLAGEKLDVRLYSTGVAAHRFERGAPPPPSALGLN